MPSSRHCCTSVASPTSTSHVSAQVESSFLYDTEKGARDDMYAGIIKNRGYDTTGQQYARRGSTNMVTGVRPGSIRPRLGIDPKVALQSLEQDLRLKVWASSLHPAYST